MNRGRGRKDRKRGEKNGRGKWRKNEKERERERENTIRERKTGWAEGIRTEITLDDCGIVNPGSSACFRVSLPFPTTLRPSSLSLSLSLQPLELCLATPKTRTILPLARFRH